MFSKIIVFVSSLFGSDPQLNTREPEVIATVTIPEDEIVIVVFIPEQTHN